MDVRKFNTDLHILEREYNIHDKYGRTLLRNVFWKSNGDGSYTVYIKGVSLPDNANMKKTNIKIYAPANLYDPAGVVKKYFYSNIWIDPNVKIKYPNQKGWGQLPRLHCRDSDGFAYLCFHPQEIQGNENVLHFIATLKVFIKNANPNIW